MSAVLPIAPLLRALEVNTPAGLGKAVGVDAGTARAAMANGISPGKASAWCHYAGVDFNTVWCEPAKAAPKLVAVTPAEEPPVLPDGMQWVEELPPGREPGGRTRNWADRLAPLRERPGQWALVITVDTSKKAIQRRGHMRKVLGADWEVANRPVPDGHGLFARYVGERA